MPEGFDKEGGTVILCLKEDPDSLLGAYSLDFSSASTQFLPWLGYKKDWDQYSKDCVRWNVYRHKTNRDQVAYQNAETYEYLCASQGTGRVFFSDEFSNPTCVWIREGHDESPGGFALRSLDGQGYIYITQPGGHLMLNTMKVLLTVLRTH